MFKYKLVKEDSCFNIMRKWEVLALIGYNIYGASVIIEKYCETPKILFILYKPSAYFILETISTCGYC